VVRIIQGKKFWRGGVQTKNCDKKHVKRPRPARPVGNFRRCSASATACMVHCPRLCVEGMTNLGLILLLILLVLLSAAAGSIWGCHSIFSVAGLGLLLVILIIVLLVRG
jgi:hypothetical protein